ARRRLPRALGAADPRDRQARPRGRARGALRRQRRGASGVRAGPLQRRPRPRRRRGGVGGRGLARRVPPGPAPAGRACAPSPRPSPAVTVTMAAVTAGGREPDLKLVIVGAGGWGGAGRRAARRAAATGPGEVGTSPPTGGRGAGLSGRPGVA